MHHQHWAKSYTQQIEDGFLIHHQNYQSAYKGKPAPSDTPMTARKRLEEKRPNTFIGRSFGVGDVIVWDEEKERKFFYVDKEELVEFGGFMDADAAGNTVVYMVPNYQIDGKTGTWLPYDSEVVEGVCFFMMRNEQRKDTVSPIVVDSKGVFVTDAPNGFENIRAVLAEYVHRAEKKQQDMTEHEKFDEPEMIKVEEIVLPPKENTEEDEGETVKKKIYIFPPEWAGTFGQPITSIAQVGILRQEHYAGNWDVFRPATEIEEMNIFTAESLNELLREAEKIMEGWTDYR